MFLSLLQIKIVNELKMKVSFRREDQFTFLIATLLHNWNNVQICLILIQRHWRVFFLVVCVFGKDLRHLVDSGFNCTPHFLPCFKRPVALEPALSGSGKSLLQTPSSAWIINLFIKFRILVEEHKYSSILSFLFSVALLFLLSAQ